jgi:ABC-type Zn2+ transport system substrate-binding protein/surface adhesin
LYSNVELTPEEEDRLIEITARKIHEYGMEAAAILFLESSKPIAWVGGEMGRFFITPFIPIFSEEWGVKSEKFLRTFEKRENIEKLLTRLEELSHEDDKSKKGADKLSQETEQASDSKNVKTP